MGFVNNDKLERKIDENIVQISQEYFIAGN